MGKKKKEEAMAYTLVIDKGRNSILNMLFNAITMLPHEAQIAFMEMAKDENLDLIGLSKEISDRTHEFDWCEDPECEVKK